MAETTLATHLDWMAQGTQLFRQAVAGLSDAQLAEPSLLPGWDRAHVLAHVSRNADALINLLTWARTGVETPMYASMASRDADIETTAALPPAQLRRDLAASTDRLDADVAAMSEQDWAGPVRTRQGRATTGAEVPWMRCRELWVHVVDLDAGVGFAQYPGELAQDLLAEAVAYLARADGAPSVRIRASDTGAEQVMGGGDQLVSAPTLDLLPWVLGRGGTNPAPWPPLPAWL